ncbi:hypothetical protein HWV62_18778 [Athelia sp. TMB]|nr:hypothetical protein HWV62_18778 [Athelia sp. TMB]
MSMFNIPSWSVESHLEFNESAGIEKAILSISSPGVYFGDVEKAAILSRKCNEYTAEIKRQHPTRFGFFASVPLPDTERAIAEAEYALKYLNADGIVLMSSYDTVYLGDPSFAEFFDALHRLNATVFVHPTSPCSTSSNVPGAPGKFHPLPYPNPFSEFFFDSTRTAFSLLMNDTFNRCSGMKMILTHAGCVLPPLIDRFQGFATGGFGNKDGHAMQPLQKTVFERVYFDLSGAVLPNQLPGLLQIADPKKLYYGSDYPFTPAATAAMYAEKLEGTDVMTEELKRGALEGSAWKAPTGK